MKLSFHLPIISLLAYISWCQFIPETYPDPRIDPFRCKIPAVGPLCDPSELLTFEEKEALVNRIKQLTTYAATIPNSSPSCQLFPGKSLDIMIGVVDRIGFVPNAPTDTEKFANNLKNRYQHYQDANLCDLMVLIVNSYNDRQIFTVAGKDTKLTKDVLKTAFEQNINHFEANRYATGLQGMIEFIATSYLNAQLSQFATPLSAFLPAPLSPNNEVITTISDIRRTINNLDTSTAVTIPTFHTRYSRPGGENEIGGENFIVPAENKSDQLWIDILTKAVARCGSNREKMAKYAQAVVEEAMALSLRLISDQRYLTIEEKTQSLKNDSETRSQVWNEAKEEFIDGLYKKYLTTIRSKANLRCPTVSETAHIFSALK
uniref:VWFA domain-containing protein n=1 Tax=Elaeophora elaphi TaxID=1147741 RepID=A0A0R3RR66_9BILA